MRFLRTRVQNRGRENNILDKQIIVLSDGEKRLLFRNEGTAGADGFFFGGGGRRKK